MNLLTLPSLPRPHRYVWLIPVFTSTASAAVTGFSIAIQKSADPAFNDLAKGAGGDYRYLLLENDAEQAEKVTEVALLRLGEALVERPAGWDGNTIDINKGRGKTYLYLLWKIAA